MDLDGRPSALDVHADYTERCRAHTRHHEGRAYGDFVTLGELHAAAHHRTKLAGEQLGDGARVVVRVGHTELRLVGTVLSQEDPGDHHDDQGREQKGHRGFDEREAGACSYQEPAVYVVTE